MHLSTLLLIALPALIICKDPIDQVAKQGAEIISSSRLTGQTVRQCSCHEQRECVEDMKKQAKECVPACFQRFSTITDRPDDLRKCFEQKDDIVQNFMTCIEDKVEGCVDHDHGNQIDKTDISALFTIGEKKLTHHSATMDAIIAPIRNVIDAAGEFALCVKDCFLKKNENGFCFDRKNCQPLILENKAKNSFRTCTKKVNWKREAGELCECSVEAGVTVLRQYCSMFSLMGRRRGSQSNRG
ncbi:unnamed protein product [Auanema sp. JU1783]|nr:unnamed protein product [Auanema sp. JU1783]